MKWSALWPLFHNLFIVDGFLRIIWISVAIDFYSAMPKKSSQWQLIEVEYFLRDAAHS